MALVKLTFPNQSRTKINTIQVDALANESPNYQNTITQNPTEDGDTVSDNIIVQPDQLTLNCIISDTSRIPGVETDIGAGRRSSVAYFDIKKLRNDRAIFDVQTGRDLYKDMAIASFRPVRNSTNTNAMEFTIDLQKIIKVSSRTVSIPRPQIKDTPTEAKDQAQGTVNKGSQQTSPANEKSSSFALSLWRTFFQ